MSDRVKVDIEGGVADVKLVRSDKMNALDNAMFEAIIDTIENLKKEQGLRAVVLSGEGRAFCAGLDMGNFANMASGGVKKGGGSTVTDGLATRTHGVSNKPQYAVWGWRELQVPVLAAVHGVAFGGGFQLMLGADMRYVAPDARLSILEIKWGLIPDMAGTMIMRHLCRDDIIRELTYTGRVFSGEEALDFGFATRVCDKPYHAALEVAHEIAGKSPDAIRAGKRIFNSAPLAEIEAGLMTESVEQAGLIGSKNQIESIMANLEKRAPEFED